MCMRPFARVLRIVDSLCRFFFLFDPSFARSFVRNLFPYYFCSAVCCALFHRIQSRHIQWHLRDSQLGSDEPLKSSEKFERQIPFPRQTSTHSMAEEWFCVICLLGTLYRWLRRHCIPCRFEFCAEQTIYTRRELSTVAIAAQRSPVRDGCDICIRNTYTTHTSSRPRAAAFVIGGGCLLGSAEFRSCHSTAVSIPLSFHCGHSIYVNRSLCVCVCV